MADPKRWAIVNGAPSGGSLPVTDPAPGGRVDCLSREGYRWNPAAPGRVLFIEAGSGINAGDDLATDGSGRAVPAGSGDVVVAEALSGAFSAGQGVWVVMLTQG